MKLIQNETKISSIYYDKIWLTDHRVVIDDLKLGKSYNYSVFLENISSIEIVTKGYRILLYIGIFFTCLGILPSVFSFMANSTFILFLGIAGLISYFLTNRRVLLISSQGGSHLIGDLKNISQDDVLIFSNQIIQAKSKRMDQLFQLNQ